MSCTCDLKLVFLSVTSRHFYIVVIVLMKLHSETLWNYYKCMRWHKGSKYSVFEAAAYLAFTVIMYHRVVFGGDKKNAATTQTG